MRWLTGLTTLMALAWASHAHAADCAAAQALNGSVHELELRKSAVQRREWLLLEFLTSDSAKASRALYAQEISRSVERMRVATAMNAEVASLPVDALTSAQEGSAECDVLTRVKKQTDEMISARTKEIDGYTHDQFPFLEGCHQIADALVRFAGLARDPQTKPETIRAARLALSIALGPAMYRSHVSPDDFDALAGASLEAPELAEPTRTAYLSLRCLKHYQGQTRRLKTLKDAAPALAACNPGHWIELGTCASTAVLPAK